jgi:hypothetical protein
MNNAAFTAIQERRRRGAATEKISNATNMRSVSVMARSGAKLCGKSQGTGRTAEFEGAVVVTVAVIVTGALSVNELGEGVHVLAGMALLQETVTEPLNPPEGATNNANVAERDLELAPEIQAGFLPEAPPVLPGIKIAVSHCASQMVGGDYYDFLCVNADGKEALLLVVADVEGKARHQPW